MVLVKGKTVTYEISILLEVCLGPLKGSDHPGRTCRQGQAYGDSMAPGSYLGSHQAELCHGELLFPGRK